MRTYLITGAQGQLGTHLVRKARERGAEVVGVCRRELDVTDAAAVRNAVRRGMTVINCAAYTAVDRAETDSDVAFAVNATGPANLADACETNGARLIHISTDYVFDGTSRTPYEPADPTGPRTVYGASKLAGERALAGRATVVRTAWVYTGARNDFVATMRRLERERETLRVVNDQVGSPTFAADLADGLLELATVEGDGVLHATNAGVASWFDLAQAVFAEIGADPARVEPCTSEEFVRPAPRPAYSVLSQRSWVDAGLTPLRDWRTALHAAVSPLGWAT